MGTVQEYTDGLREACQRSGMVDPDCAEWAAALLVQMDYEGHSMDAMARAVRAAGDPVPSPEKKASGYNTRMKLGRQFFRALTEKGRHDPMEAAKVIVHHAVMRAGRLRTMAQLQESRAPFARFTSVQDGRTCANGKRLHGMIMDKNKLPELPLPDCDEPMCRCGFQYYIEELHGPARRADMVEVAPATTVLTTAPTASVKPEPAAKENAAAKAARNPNKEALQGFIIVLVVALLWWLL